MNAYIGTCFQFCNFGLILYRRYIFYKKKNGQLDDYLYLRRPETRCSLHLPPPPPLSIKILSMPSMSQKLFADVQGITVFARESKSYTLTFFSARHVYSGTPHHPGNCHQRHRSSGGFRSDVRVSTWIQRNGRQPKHNVPN